MAKQKYGWKEKAIGLKHLDAQAIGEELRPLYRKFGQKVPAQAVVDKAANPELKMHACFEWDDTEAARQHRLEQARYLLRSYTVRMLDDTGGERVTRATVSIRDEDAPEHCTYAETEYAMNDPELRARAVATALREVVAWQRRYAELEELAEVFDAIKKARRRTNKKAA